MATLPQKVNLTAQQKSALEKILSVAKRGEYAARVYLQSKFGSKIDFECEKIPGADISAKINGVPTAFEVKATRDSTIALRKLKVSSKRSHGLIVGGCLVLRVMKADTAEPTIAELHHGVDFELRAEPRWRAENP